MIRRPPVQMPDAHDHRPALPSRSPAFTVGCAVTLGNLAPTAQSGAEQAGFAIGATLGFGTLAALWFFPMVGALVLGIFLKNSAIVERGYSQRAEEDAIIAQAKQARQEQVDGANWRKLRGLSA